MKRIRLGTALLVVAIAALVLALVAQQRRAAIREAALRAEVIEMETTLQSMMTDKEAARARWRSDEIKSRQAIRRLQFDVDQLKLEVSQRDPNLLNEVLRARSSDQQAPRGRSARDPE